VKRILILFGCCGFLHFEFILGGWTVSQESYLSILQHTGEAVQKLTRTSQ
jgi:hypothetical protein